MKNYRNFVCMAFVGVALAFGLSACGDDDSSFSPRDDDENLSSEVDGGDGSSSSIKDNSSSSKGDGGSSGSNSSSSAAEDESSSSEEVCAVFTPEAADTTKKEPGEPTYEVTETCEEVGACDAMVKADVSTWHFIRKDNFGDDAEYIYKADGKDLIITIKNADGTTESKTYSMYNMESEAGIEMAFSAAKSTCKDGGGNDKTTTSCTKDSVLVEPGKTAVAWPPADVNAGSKYDASANTLTDLRDNKVYKTVKIGDQVWMAQNLNYAYLNSTYDDGEEWFNSSKDSSSFCYNNSPKNCEKMGRLYMWSAVMDSAEVFSTNGAGCGIYDNAGVGSSVENTCNPQGNVRGVCPKGWHVPSKEELNKLLSVVDPSGSEGYFPKASLKLRSKCGWDETEGEDAFGFNATPTGYCYLGLDCNGGTKEAEYWTSTQSTSDDTWTNARSSATLLEMSSTSPSSSTFDDGKTTARAVRCVMD